MRNAFVLFGALTLLIATPILSRGDDDAEGCKDSELITRMPGSWISSCEHKEFDQHEVQVHSGNDEKDRKTLEGELSYWQYTYRQGTSALQNYRNVENALKSGGFTIVWSLSGDNIVARKGDTWLHFEFYDNTYNQYVIKVKEMAQEMTADASKLQGELESSGHVAVYGIHFDTGKAAILPDSEPQLDGIKKLLEGNADLRLSIEGHTDNQGSSAANQALSQKRAQAVMAWLTANGVDASRLSAKGFGDAKPVADNGTEDGRAKNRRVELVKK